MTHDASSPQLLGFDTESLPASERMARYRALYGIGAEVSATGPAPRATFRGWRLDRAILYDRYLNDIGHNRPAAKLGLYGLTHWTVTLVLEGFIAFDLGTGMQQISPGEVLFVDTSTAGRNDARHAHIATLSIAQDRLEEMLGPVGSLHGHVIPLGDGQLYAGFVRSLLATLPTMHNGAFPTLTSTLGMILKAALAISGRAQGAASSTQHAQRMTQIRFLVDARLADPDFGTEAATAASGLSRATLYRLLQPHGGLAAFVKRRRLEQIRQCLSDPGDVRRFAAIAQAAGFRDESQASRAFLISFGIRPTAYRAAIVRAEPDEQFRAWQQDLR